MLDQIELVPLQVVGLDHDAGARHRPLLLVDHQALEADVRQPDELVERVHVVAPVLAEGAAGRPLLAAELHGDLEAVGGQVVEVLHAAAHRVPLGAVGDSVGEVVGDHVTLDLELGGHVGVHVGEEERDVLEELVVGRGRVLGLVVVRVVVGVVDHQVAAVKVGREHERVVDDPARHGQRLRLELEFGRPKENSYIRIMGN